MSNENVVTLTQLIYSKDLTGPFRMYLMTAEGYHNGGIWFQKVPRDSDEIPARDAWCMMLSVIGNGCHEVRITNALDELVFHWRTGEVLHPHEADMHHFWRTLGVF